MAIKIKTPPHSLSLKKTPRNMSSKKTPPKLLPKKTPSNLSPRDKSPISFKLKTRKNQSRKNKKVSSEDLPPSNYPLVYASNKYKEPVDNLYLTSTPTGMVVSFDSPKSITSTLTPSPENYESPDNNEFVYSPSDLEYAIGKEAYENVKNRKTVKKTTPVLLKPTSPVKPKGENPFARKGPAIKNPFFPNNGGTKKYKNKKDKKQ
jgi:hypothetical protein